MARISDLEKARTSIIDFFMAGGAKAYRQADLRNILDDQRSDWYLGKSIRFEKFVEFVSEALPLEKVYLRFDYRTLFGSSRVKETGIGKSSFKK